MLKTLMITTAIGGLMIGSAVAEGNPPPASSPPPAAKAQPAQPAKPDAAMNKSDSSITKSDKSASNAPTTQGSAQFINSQRADQWLASKFKGTDVIGTDNQKIGDVSDILFDKTGRVEAFVIGVGGFLGMGAKDVALAPSSFQVVPGDKSKNEADKLKLAMTKDQLKQASNFEPYNPPRSTTGMATPSSRPKPMSPQPTSPPATGAPK